MSEPNNRFMDNDGFAALLGVEITQADKGQASGQMELKKEHLNGHGSVHGAVIFSLADIVFAAACNSETASIGIQADIRYFAKPEGNMLVARAYELNTSKKVANYQVEVCDSSDKEIAKFSAVAYRF